MADAPISGLPESTTVGDNDLILLEQAGVAKKVKGQNWKQYFSANVITASVNVIEPDVNPSAYYNRSSNNLALSLPSADYIDTVTKTGTSHLTDEYTITSKLGHTGKFYVTNGAGSVDTVNEQSGDEYGNVQLYGTDITMSSTDDDTIQSRLTTAETDISTAQSAITELQSGKAASANIAYANLDDISTSGLYKITGTAGTLMHINYDSNYALQLYNNYPDGDVLKFRRKNGTWFPWISISALPTVITIQLPYASWTLSSTDVYTQSVNIGTVTSKTKVDLQPSASVILQLANDGVSGLYVENNNGTLTAYAVGDAPTADLNVQATRYETA